MNRVQYLAAEVFGYSYDHYQEKVEMRHIRFTKYMPNTIRQLEKAESDSISDIKLAEIVEIDVDKIKGLKEAFENAKRIVDTKNAGVSFENGVRASVKNFMEKENIQGVNVENLVEQIFYRAADLGFLLKEENKELSDYSEMLRYII